MEPKLELQFKLTPERVTVTSDLKLWNGERSIGGSMSITFDVAGLATSLGQEFSSKDLEKLVLAEKLRLDLTLWKAELLRGSITKEQFDRERTTVLHHLAGLENGKKTG